MVVSGVLAQGVARPWLDHVVVGIPDMTAPATSVVADQRAPINLGTDRTIAGIDRRGRTGEYSTAQEGAISNPTDGFTAVVLAVPAPQTQELIVGARLRLPNLEHVRYAPCWSPFFYVAPSQASWSKTHLEMTKAETLPLLLETFQCVTGSQQQPLRALSHR
jgi:hypothetical protein